MRTRTTESIAADPLDCLLAEAEAVDDPLVRDWLLALADGERAGSDDDSNG